VICEDRTTAPAALPAACARPCRVAALLSAGHVVLTAAEKAELAKRGAAAVEMEALAVGLRARQWGVPSHAVKADTDTAGEDLPLDLNAARRRDGSLSTARILAAAARHPLRLTPGLVTLYHRSHLAARSLGEFLADCRF
jgi:nucleoside phosphorylase